MCDPSPRVKSNLDRCLYKVNCLFLVAGSGCTDERGRNAIMYILEKMLLAFSPVLCLIYFAF